MVYVYPTKIQGTTGRSTKYNTQYISNPNALCSGSTSLAYWGVKDPTYVGNYLRNWYDSVTSISGSYCDPETIYASGFKIPDAPDEAIIKSIHVEYKWEQVSYSCGTMDCFGRFGKPTISLMYKGKAKTTIQGHAPEAIRYNNNTSNKSKMNVNNAELATLHSHTLQVPDNITVKDLRNGNVKIKFDPAKNTYSNHCRIIMQFLRLKVTYKDIAPTFRVTSTISESKTQVNKEYTYKVTIKSSNKRTAQTSCSVMFSDKNTKIISAKTTTGTGSYSKGIWTITKFSNDKATLTIKCSNAITGTKCITTTINKYADSVNKSTKQCININAAPAPVVNFDFKMNHTEPLIFKTTDQNIGILYVTLKREKITKKTETIVIDTAGLVTPRIGWTGQDNVTLAYNGDGKWTVSNIQVKELTLTSNDFILSTAGEYNCSAIHTETGEPHIEKNIKINVLGEPLDKEYFKLRVEDGSDIKYNSLMFTQGDDLTIPLTYEIQDLSQTLIKNMTVNGEQKRIPTSEAQFIHFNIDIKDTTKEKYENTVCFIEAVNSEGDECSDIIIGGANGIEMFGGSNNRYCIIHELKTDKVNNIKLIVQSDIEQTCTIKLKPLNYDQYEVNNTQWTPSTVYFKDVPNIKISIEGISDLTYTNDDDSKFSLYYHIENKSDTDAQNVKFKIKEPSYFKKIAFDKEIDNNNYTLQHYLTDENLTETSPWFNDNSRVITFPTLPAHSKIYTLRLDYQATKNGIYDFIINTLDYADDFDDDQYKNSYTHKLLVNVNNYIEINTFTSKSNPSLNELFDLKIKVKNYYKKQNNFIFNVKDIGEFDTLHTSKDYTIEYVDCPKGIFTPNTENNNILGTWVIDNIDINEEIICNISLRPTDVGTHVIQTEFINGQKELSYHENIIKISEENRKISFNVEHAINEAETGCDIESLAPICDNDFINIGDTIYYLITINNNDRNDIEDVYIYGRLPQSFIENGIECHSPKYVPEINTNTGLVNLHIPKIPRCGQIQYAFSVTPTKTGDFNENFMLTARNAHILHKQLSLTIDTEIVSQKLEHEINIYNFDKTHRYYRYEIDGVGNIFKYYNKGDISDRTVDIEDHQYSALETYRGTNLKQLVKDIKNNSKYVEPELIRIGNNHLDTKGYEMYPDGFIRRFGLLNSEVYHTTGQLPQITNLVDYAMRWDVDNWDTKVWAGDKYNNGVFSLSVDYSKIPTNFNILDSDNPIHTLQTLVDRVKPFGTRAICYYSNTVSFDLKMATQLQNVQTFNRTKLPIKLDKTLGLISSYNRHDNSIATYYDITNHQLSIKNINVYSDTKNKNTIGALNTDIDYSIDIYTDKYERQYAKDCLDILENFNTQSVQNIKIQKNINNFSNNYVVINNKGDINNMQDGYIYALKFNTDIDDKQSLGFQINNTRIIREKDNINNFNGFKIIEDDNIIASSSTLNDINTFIIHIQCIKLEETQSNRYMMMVWTSINDKYFDYLGAFYVNGFDAIILRYINTKNDAVNYAEIDTDAPLIFSVNDKDNIMVKKPSLILGDKWNYLNRVNNQGYAYFENKIDIDKECSDKYINIPILSLKYNNINISAYDEITDISFKIKAHTNKNDFGKNIKMMVCKDGDSYMPLDNISRKTYYPTQINNINQEFLTTLSISQPNITICAHCLKTTLGYYDTCPYCGSTEISHYDEKIPVTICNNCEYIADGWNDYCVHCLSTDVEKVLVDFNKTYCYDCQAMYNEYYTACPNCLSTNIVHLQNDEKSYQIFDDNNQNIDPIIVQSNINRVNICNITVPLNKDNTSLSLLSKLLLKLDVTNHNDGFYSYCPDCHILHIGHYNMCPYCNSHQIQNLKANDISFDIYLEMNNKTTKIDIDDTLSYGNTEFVIDILSIAKQNTKDSFTLKIYAENLTYHQDEDNIKKIDTDEQYINNILSDVQKLDISINNMSLESKYLHENEWIGLDNITGINHTGITYIINNEEETDAISFSNFNIDENNLENLYLHIHGINKTYAHVDMDIKIIDEFNNIYNKKISGINNDLFHCIENIFDITQTKNLGKISVQVSFSNIKPNKEIILTSCYIITEKTMYDNDIPDVDSYNTIVTQNNDEFLITDASNSLWGLNDTMPYYLSGQQLHNHLACFLSLGKLNLSEYIRLYSIEMIVTYKNKYGYFITDSIPISKEEHVQQLISGDIQKHNAENWGSVKVSTSTLNNLEYDININSDDEQLLNSIPLLNKLSQSFIMPTNSLYKIQLDYFGPIGYPEEFITIALYDDDNNSPGNLIHSRDIQMPTIKNIVDIDFYVDALDDGSQYWLVLEDSHANNDNYHRFRFNIDNNVGSLLINNNYDDNMSLSFNIDSSSDKAEYQELPTTWQLDTDINSDFKLYNSLYRYNIQPSSNVYLKNLLIKSGYTYSGEEISPTEEGDYED